ncbi:hypothetical protein D9M71_89230 [compost metagenome]
MVAQLVDVVLLAADAAAQRGDQGADLLGGEHLVEARLLHVEDLALQREDRLGLAVAALLGRATRGVTLHDVQFGEGGILLLAVGELAGQAGDIQRALAAGHFAGLARGFAGTGGVDHLADHGLGFVGVLQQEVGEVLAHFLFHRGLHLGGDQLVLGLRAEFRVRHLHRDDRSQAFTGIVTGGGDLVLLRQAFGLDVVVQVAGEGGAEAGQVGAAVALRNVVGEAEDVLVEAVVPLQGDLHANAVFLALHVEMEDLVHRRLVGVQVFDEGAQAALVLEQLFLAGTLVLQHDAHAGVQEGQLADALGEDVPAEMNVVEGFRGRLEVNFGAGAIGIAHRTQRELWNTVVIELFPDLAFAANGQAQLVGEGVHYRDTHAMQAAGDLVAVVIELTAGVQHGHDDFRRRNPFFLVDIHRNAAAVVAYGDRLIGVNGDADFAAETRQRLVDGVVHHLEDHVVQTGTVVRVADVHARTLAYRVQSLQHLDAGRVVRVVLAHSSLPMVVS